MDVFRLRDNAIHDYAEDVRSFVQIREPRLREFIKQSLTDEAALATATHPEESQL